MAGGILRRGGVIAATFLAAFMLTALPLPDWAAAGRPAWVVMVLVYWCMALPNRVGVLTGFCFGLLLDVLGGAVLGQHALALALLAYFTVSHHHQLRVFPLGQQALVVGLMVAFYVLLIQAARWWLEGFVPQPWHLALPVLTSMVLWPWLFIVLRDVRRRAHLT